VNGEVSSELRRKDLLVPDHDVLFGASLGQWNGADAADAAGRIRLPAHWTPLSGSDWT
jgi:hypothetical protein